MYGLKVKVKSAFEPSGQSGQADLQMLDSALIHNKGRLQFNQNSENFKTGANGMEIFRKSQNLSNFRNTNHLT